MDEQWKLYITIVKYVMYDIKKEEYSKRLDKSIKQYENEGGIRKHE